jgi:hypothetical protein
MINTETEIILETAYFNDLKLDNNPQASQIDSHSPVYDACVGLCIINYILGSRS